MLQSIGAAIVGSGFMGRTHNDTLRRIGVRVVGILGSSAEKSAAACEALGIARAFSSLDELLEDPGVQVVHVVTPNRHHFDIASRGLKAGKHVICEKPLAMTSAESAQLVELARARPGQLAAVNYNIRFYPLSIEARERIRRGDLGEVAHVSGAYVQDWLLLPTDYNWRVLPDEGGALRAVADIGTHWLDLVQFLTGSEVESLCADLQTVRTRRWRPRGEVETFTGIEPDTVNLEPIDIETEDYGAILLRYRNGMRGVVHVSQTTAGRKNCLHYEVAGTCASLSWNSEHPDELWVGRREGPNELLLRDPNLLTHQARTAVGYPGGHNEGYGDTFRAAFHAMYQAIAVGTTASPTYPTFEDGHREIVLCEAVLASHQRRGWVDLEERVG